MRAFPLVVNKFNDKDYVEKLVGVNQDSVIQLLVRLTQPRINRYLKKVRKLLFRLMNTVMYININLSTV